MTTQEIKPPHLFNAAVEALWGVTHHYVKTGVAIVDTRHDKKNNKLWSAPLSPASVRVYLRELADDMDRIFVVAEWDGAIVELTIPDNKRTSNVFAPLLLVAQELPGRLPRINEWKLDGGCVATYTMTASRRFFFKGKDGIDVFNEFVKQCETNRVNRIALKLD